MQNRYVIALLISLAAASARADEFMHIKLSELMELRAVRNLAGPDIKLYWGDTPTPPLVETTAPDRFSGTGISVIPWNLGRRHCEEAFVKIMRTMYADARKSGYDVIYNIRPTLKEGPTSDTTLVSCSLSPATARAYFTATLGMSEGGRAWVEAQEAEADRRAALEARPPAKNAVYIALDPILESAEAKAILGSDVTLHRKASGIPAFSLRYGPANYSESPDGNKYPPEDVCRQAVLLTLNEMAKDARENGFDGIIRVRSVLDGQLTPSPNDVECLVRGKDRTATVRLRAVLIKKKS
ncbi:MAG: hypothetical protein QM776_11470 [Rhodocyclaceae bacterium]